MLSFYLSLLSDPEDKILFTQMFTQYYLACYHVAAKKLRSHHLAEETVQDMFLQIINTRDKVFNLPEADRKRRLIAITKSRCLDTLRKRETIRTELDIDELEDALHAKIIDAKTQIDVEAQVSNEISYQELRRILLHLHPVNTVILEMRYVLGYKTSEIARELDMTISAVEKRITRMKEQARTLLEGEVQNGKVRS